MPLRSKLFRGDARLEAAAVSDSAHVTPGSRGPHVGKLQTALNQTNSVGLVVDGIYGPKTAQAVLAYKTQRGIINRAIQTTPDNIVGRLTIASLDREMLKQEQLGPPEIVVVMGGRSATCCRRAASRLPARLRPRRWWRRRWGCGGANLQ